MFFFVGFFGVNFWVSSTLEWLTVFLYMTLTMLIMAALPSQDQITLSAHIINKKRARESNEKTGGS